MSVLRMLLIAMLVGILVFTGFAVQQQGPNLIPHFFGNLTAMNWSGQFNYDFLCYLVLSGIWLAWRHEFSIQGIIMGIVTSILGILFFAPYLFIVSLKADGDVRALLLGPGRV